jgi:hypothetical protein
MSPAELVYLLCAAASLAAAAMLLRYYSRRKTPLLLWSSVGFLGLAVNNVQVYVYLVLYPDVDLALIRALLARSGCWPSCTGRSGRAAADAIGRGVSPGCGRDRGVGQRGCVPSAKAAMRFSRSLPPPSGYSRCRGPYWHSSVPWGNRVPMSTRYDYSRLWLIIVAIIHKNRQA